MRNTARRRHSSIGCIEVNRKCLSLWRAAGVLCAIEPVVRVYRRSKDAVAGLILCQGFPIRIGPGNVLLREHTWVVHSHPVGNGGQQCRPRNVPEPAGIVEIIMKQAAVETREHSAVEDLLDPVF